LKLRNSVGEEVQIGVVVPWEVDEATSLIINFLKSILRYKQKIDDKVYMPESLFLDKKEPLKDAASS
jgi:hypothetical protein